MKKILWVSRHPLAPEAVGALKEKFGGEEVHIETMNLLFPDSSSASYAMLAEAAKGFDMVGFVPPAQLTAELVRNVSSGTFLNITGFFVISKPVVAENGQRQFVFDHIEYFEI